VIDLLDIEDAPAVEPEPEHDAHDDTDQSDPLDIVLEGAT